MYQSFPHHQKALWRGIQDHCQSLWHRHPSHWLDWIHSQHLMGAYRITMAIYALRTTSNREDQVMDFVVTNVQKKKLPIFSLIRPHGLRGYIFIESDSRQACEEAYFKVPYARGLLPAPVDYKEIEHMLEQVKVQMNIQKSDIVEIISGPFKREQARVTRVDQTKEEVVVELLEAAVPIPITVKLDSVKVVRRDEDDDKKGKGK